MSVQPQQDLTHTDEHFCSEHKDKETKNKKRKKRNKQNYEKRKKSICEVKGRNDILAGMADRQSQMVD